MNLQIKTANKKCIFLFVLLISYFVFQFHAFADLPQKQPFSFAISGGISLGSYEAGLNWAIVKMMKKRRIHAIENNQPYPHLVSISGASAGGINTLLTAISWCVDEDKIQNNKNFHDTARDNIFYSAWCNIGLEELLPRNDDAYKKNDALLSRAEFMKVTDNLKELLKEDIYREDCDIPFALIVTRTHPLILEVEGIKVKNERFVIPLKLVSDKEHPGKIKILNHIVDNSSPLFGNVIYLQTEGNQISPKSLIDAALATSAFPVAFGRISLNYCNCIENTDLNTGVCPDRCAPESADFVDGGVFDNVPLGVAKALAEESYTQGPDHLPPYNYIYMAPDNRRPPKTEDTDKIKEERSYGLANQLSFLAGAISTGQDYELYNVLRSVNWNDPERRRLLLTTRYPSLTGSYLGHFGAFLDRTFRDYDYYAGVYDAIHGIAEYDCVLMGEQINTRDACIGENAQKIFNELIIPEKGTDNHKNSDNTELIWVLSQMAQKEYGESDAWTWLTGRDIDPNLVNGNLRVITELILKDCNQDSLCKEPDFKKFLNDVASNPSFEKSRADEAIRNIMRVKDEKSLFWYYPFAARASSRLLKLEKEAKKEGEPAYPCLFGFASHGIERFLSDEKSFTLNRSSAKNNWFRLLPYEIGVDVRSAHKEWAVSWEPQLLFTPKSGLNLKLMPLAIDRTKTGDIFEFTQADLLYTYKQRNKILSSFGLGMNINYTYDQEPDSRQTNFGATFQFGLVDFIRITAGYRSMFGGDFAGEDYFFQIGVTDFSGIIYWATKAF
ncbi:MAG: patatin-like phospholipase family protein [bacterium]